MLRLNRQAACVAATLPTGLNWFGSLLAMGIFMATVVAAGCGDAAPQVDAAAAAACTDKVKNGTETDIDCGGTCPTCADGKACTAAGDCTNGVCTNTECVPAADTCVNKSKDGEETDVDCGGTKCAACDDGKGCVKKTDCKGAHCTDNVCVTPPPPVDMTLPPAADSLAGAADLSGITDSSTTAADLLVQAADQGSTPSNDLLASPSDLASPADQATQQTNDLANAPDLLVVPSPDLITSPSDLLVAATCKDGQKNGGETDVDCGGSCPACVEGKACNAGTDCSSMACFNQKCVNPTCSDGVKNGIETDTDCGGTCMTKCADGKGCKANADCASSICMANQCVAAGCGDKVKNGTETDVDCGGPGCLPCANTKACVSAGDCASGVCTAGKCITPTCTDRVKNGLETDVDCGGLCPACPSGSSCTTNSDCASNACKLSVCLTPSCNDSIKNGAETDVDCGGASQNFDTWGDITCSRCATGKACTWNGDCLSWSCVDGVCRSPSCVDGRWDGAEADVDCGLACPNGCALNRRCHQDEDCDSGFCSKTSSFFWFGTCAVRPICSAGITQCGNTCVNTQTDAANCGACNKACAAGQTCQMGVCGSTCSGGQTACNNACVNTATDPANCGSCGNKCGAGKTCLASVCVSLHCYDATATGPAAASNRESCFTQNNSCVGPNGGWDMNTAVPSCGGTGCGSIKPQFALCGVAGQDNWNTYAVNADGSYTLVH